MKKLPTELIRESLKIDAQSPSGLTWLHRPRSHFNSDFFYKKVNQQHAGKPAGYPDTRAWYIKINKTKIGAHRIVYYLAYNIDPYPFQVDHKDRNPFNNQPLNLRLSDSSTNGMNRMGKPNSTSKYKGVCFVTRLKKWRASILKKGCKRIYLGHFDSEEEAFEAYKKVALEIHGEFACF